MPNAITRLLNDLLLRSRLSDRDIANVLNKQVLIVTEWRSGHKSPNVGAQSFLAQLHFAVERLCDHYIPSDIRIWLFAQHELLSGDTAADRIAQGDVISVLKIIDGLDVFVAS